MLAEFAQAHDRETLAEQRLEQSKRLATSGSALSHECRVTHGGRAPDRAGKRGVIAPAPDHMPVKMRHHIAEACPQYSLEDVSRLMSAAFRRDLLAVQRLAAYGVAVAQVEA